MPESEDWPDPTETTGGFEWDLAFISIGLVLWMFVLWAVWVVSPSTIHRFTSWSLLTLVGGNLVAIGAIAAAVKVAARGYV